MDMKFNNLFNVKQAALSALICLFGLFTTASHAQVAAEAMGTASAPKGDEYTEAKQNPSKLARVTFYRPASVADAGVTRLKLNGSYHTSLQNAAYSEVCVQAGNFELTSQIVKMGEDTINNKEATAVLEAQSGKDLFVRVLEQADGVLAMTPVKAEVAQAELKGTKRQIHVASRLTGPQDCLTPRTQAASPSNSKEYVVLVDALFAAGGRDLASLTSEGRQELDLLIVDLKRAYVNLDSARIHIAGHADPLGNATVNQKLSETRAKAIRAYMVQGGVNGEHIVAEGFGASKLAVQNCGKTATPEAVECNRPNRRVVINAQALPR